MAETELRADLVVVGAGIAGLTAARCAAEAGLDVVLLNKGARWDPAQAERATATYYAQGGIAVLDPTDPADSLDRHLADTMAAGAGLVDPVVAGAILADGPAAVELLAGWGAQFDRGKNGRYLRTCEGGHSVRRIIHAGGDGTGAMVQRALDLAVEASPVRRIDAATVTAVELAGGAVSGVSFTGPDGDGVVWAPTVALATGGAGHLYTATTNPAGATGDGIALALRAGAQVADLEFIQFHPTMFYTAGARGRRTLVSEAVRGEGGRLVDVNGDPVTVGVHPMGDLAPRDVVSRAVAAAMTRTGHPCVYLDTAAVVDFEARFPTVCAGVRAAGGDPAAPLPVLPGAHYLCGGVVADQAGRSSVPGLLALGETARTGLHGANRLASNSLLEGLVTGIRGAAEAVRRRGEPVRPGPVAEAEAVAVLPREVLQDLMSAHVAVGRTAAGLDEVAGRIATAPVRHPRGTADREDAALTTVAAMVAAAAAARTESRGAHSRLDHPDADPVAVSRRFVWRDGAPVEAVPAAAAAV